MQQELFDINSLIKADLGALSPWVEYRPNWLSNQSADLFATLKAKVQWQQPKIHVYNKWHIIPRMQAWYGDEGLTYRYSGVDHQSVGWPQALNTLKNKLMEDTAFSFNSVLLNRYRNGEDKMGWHADNEAELGKDPVVAIISLGAAREIQFKQLKSKSVSSISLEDGSLLLMKAGMQSQFHHQIPVRKKVSSERISLTFRFIVQ
ncbi:alpha-ketoglutarate-dependent dioxygenase AlkB [Psychrosphaera sp. 1_MG-2023]|uniref:alpha-ketoglutarate-dependent dioxygenase AlkB family protein n=1 Tax=Psychrosphaera sp. 1_MG-2023 TaxID=3062643 RepID=UPI0026E37CE4|nr:alpha-ketoglutarate-dependent dioxygenase AlkB [Psychrosphaera sp. 1_MG-2023]MDO6718260.1 alpha-ketoglutarate-dependent dioxygenase AlkB [Psychrosphaera sp. 1_MG-2023]